jgi:hypothetical protein
MFRLIAQHRLFTTRRRAAAALLALVLNVTLVPCAMALEAVEEAHDCCPPEIHLDAAECCLIDDVTHDARGTRIWLDEDGGAEVLLLPAFADVVAPVRDHGIEATGPPDPPLRAIPVYKLNCVYLK